MTAPAPRDRTIFVTGAAGFIGSVLCDRLCADGYRVVGYDNLSRGRLQHLPKSVLLIQGDIRDRARLKDAVSAAAPDCVIHLAAMHFIPECIARPAETLQVNVEATRDLLDVCTRGSVRHFIFASTAAVYASTDRPCVEDTTPLKPLEIYGQSKLAAEELVTTFQTTTGISATILRLFNAIGRRETNPHLVPHIFQSLQTSDVIPLGNIEARRDYVDTRDIAEAIASVCAGGLEELQVLNVGTGLTYSARDIVESLRTILARPLVVVQEPSRMRPAERMLLVADVQKIRRTTGWVTQVPFADTLEDLVSEYGLRRGAAHVQPGTVRAR